MRTLLKNGFLVDPENSIYGKKDILIDGEKILRIADEIEDSAEEIYELGGKIVFPGFIDMHVHLREPGFEGKENIETGLKAAAAGGFTGVAPMPNTNPITDSKVVIEYIKNKAKEHKYCKLYPIGAVTKGERGEELANIGEMVDSGIVGVSDDGKPVANSLLCRRAFEYLKTFDIPLMSHAEDHILASDGVMNYGVVSLRLGLKGITNSSEEVIVARDIILAEETGSRLHICHASTEGTLRLVKEAKERGVKVTVEVTPHHFSLTDNAVEELNYDTDTKVNPPLRSEKDMNAMREYIKSGVVDMIATDHAPHMFQEKSVDYDSAPNGISGIETAVGLVFTNLYQYGFADLKKIAMLMSINPRKVFKIDGGIKEGKNADITVVDIYQEWTVNSEDFYSKGKNTPFEGQQLVGKPYMTVVDGRVVMYEGHIRDII